MWIDWNDIPKAVDFMEAIKKGILEANAFIYIISPDSVASKYCDAEVEHALLLGLVGSPPLHQCQMSPLLLGLKASLVIANESSPSSIVQWNHR